jgi:hypothetical protein
MVPTGALDGKLASYGATATFMTRRLD